MFDKLTLPSAAQRATTLSFLKRFWIDGDVYQSTMDNISTILLTSFARGCIHLMGDDNKSMSAAQSEAEAAYEIVLAHPNPNSLSLDPAVISSHYSMLVENGLSSTSMEDVVKNLLSSLRLQPEALLCQSRVRLAVSMLKQAGVEVHLSESPYWVSKLLRNPNKLYTMTSSEVQQFVEHVTADELIIEPELVEVLSLIALSELRNYRVDLGSKILRLLLSRGCYHTYAEEGLRFVALQRRRDGGYGFLDPLREHIDVKINPMVAFHLPVTLNAVWLFKCLASTSITEEVAIGVGT